MNKNLDQKWHMFLSLKTFFQNHTANYSGNTALIQSVATLNTLWNTMVQLDAQASTDITGYAEDKTKRKKELSDTLVSCHLHLKPWFYEHPDSTAPMETRITVSDIKYAGDARLVIIAYKTYEYVQANLLPLAAYGLNAGTQAAMRDAITAFETESDMPYRQRDNRKKANKELEETIRQANELVRGKISLFMGPYFISDPAFYADFKRKTRLGKVQRQTMALRVKVQNAEGSPISQCHIQVKPAGNHDAVNAISKTSGQVNFQNLATGPCFITATFPNGDMQQQEVEIISSKRADVVFVMEANG